VNHDQAHGERVLLSVREVSVRLGLSERQIWHMSAGGLLPSPVKVARRLRRWRAAELTAWVNQGCPPVADGWQWPVEVNQ